MSPATPIATSVVPIRHARPNESETITPTAAPVSSRRRSRRRAAEARVGVERKQDEHPGLGRIRRVHSGRAADEAVAGLCNHEARADADDARRLAQDRLDVTRVALLALGDLERLRRRLDLVEHDHAALGFRHGLLRDDEDVAVLELDGAGDECGEVVALPNLGQPEYGEHPDFAAHFRPLRRSPTWAL